MHKYRNKAIDFTVEPSVHQIASLLPDQGTHCSDCLWVFEYDLQARCGIKKQREEIFLKSDGLA